MIYNCTKLEVWRNPLLSVSFVSLFEIALLSSSSTTSDGLVSLTDKAMFCCWYACFFKKHKHTRPPLSATDLQLCLVCASQTRAHHLQRREFTRAERAALSRWRRALYDVELMHVLNQRWLLTSRCRCCGRMNAFHIHTFACFVGVCKRDCVLCNCHRHDETTRTRAHAVRWTNVCNGPGQVASWVTHAHNAHLYAYAAARLAWMRVACVLCV